MTEREFLDVVARLYGQSWPAPLHLLQGAERVDQGIPLGIAAKEARTTPRRLKQVVEARQRLRAVLGLSPQEIEAPSRQRAIGTLGQLLLGRAAEIAFENIYAEEMKTHELELRDLRESRTDTDYRLYNARGKPVYRINIKFHGALFQRAPELVGLDPEDCFALATYKIYGALRKQQDEGLPYLFAVVGVRSLSGENVGAEIPSPFVDAVAYMYQAPYARNKRDFEDHVITRLVQDEAPVFEQTYERIRHADWFILSARRADRLVRERFYDRVFALRIPRFAQQFRAAELDMHFSLSEDLTPLRSFLSMLREAGQAKVVTLIERGDF
ncbi:MAG: hypothetical protein HY703_12405 [Gemmatimonadetes bacterium]|nr:hypothetical protein [Gemmatimonadota bacterium]